MLTVACLGGACSTSGNANALVNKLTAIKVGPLQPISEETAREVSDALVAAVRCNARDASVKIIAPAVALAGIAAVLAGTAALFAMRRRTGLGSGDHRRHEPYRRPKKDRAPVYFVDPDTGDVLDLDYSSTTFTPPARPRR